MEAPRVHKNTDRLADTGRDRDTIEVVLSGINVGQIHNAPLPDEGDSFDVLFAGQLIADKNVSVFLDALDHVADDYDDVMLGVVGDGPGADRPERQTDSLDHADRVSPSGFLDEYEDVLGQMHAADVFVSPNTREGLGITYAEAMAADCTAIGVQHPGSAASEVIGDAGYLAEPTVNSVAESLARALEGETSPTEPVKRAERYDWDSVADQAGKVYERAIDGRW